MLEAASDLPIGPIWRVSVERYHDMIAHGILGPDDPVELLEGCLAEKFRKSPAHVFVNHTIRDHLEEVPLAGWFVASQDPVTTSDSEPEPDVMVVRGVFRDYPHHHPGPEDVALVVEVADSSLGRDRNWKRRIYARAEVPVYWIANLVDRRFEVHSDPTGPGDAPDYRSRQDYGPDDELPVVLDGQEVGRVLVRDLLP